MMKTIKYDLWKSPQSYEQLFLIGESKEGSVAKGKSSFPNLSLQDENIGLVGIPFSMGRGGNVETRGK